MNGPMEMLAVVALRPEFAEKATEQDAEDIFEVGAQYVPEVALRVLAHRYPGITFRHATEVQEVYPNLLQEVARANPERALLSGLSPQLDVQRARDLLRDDPKNLKHIPEGDRGRLVDTLFAEELSERDPISVLRFAKQFLTRTRLENIAEKAFVDNARTQGFDAAIWSAYRFPTRLANDSFRLFTVALGQYGQGWSEALSIERTNLREAGRVWGGGGDFHVQAVQFSLDNMSETLAEEVARSCVLSWDFVQMQVDIGVLADWRYSNTYRGGSYFYERDLRRKGTFPLTSGPMVLQKGWTFAILARFGTNAPELPQPADPVNRLSPSLRVTLCGRWA